MNGVIFDMSLQTPRQLVVIQGSFSFKLLTFCIAVNTLGHTSA